MKSDRKTMRQCVNLYKSLGYTETHIFKGEYVLLVNPETLKMVRLYLDNGNAIEY